MPTEAVTGTHSVSTSSSPAKAGPEPEPHEKLTARENKRARRKATSKAAETADIPALADPNGNGSIQITRPDGSTVNIDAGSDGWEDLVREADPKHPSLRNG